MMDMSFDFKEMVQFQKTLDRVGEMPRKVVNKAAGKGATVAGRAIRAAAPRGKTGQLKKGFKRKKERTKVASKAVYDYAMDSAKNDLFQKPIKRPGIYGGKHKYWGYYPNSVEYGFLTRAKGGGLTYHSFGRRLRSSDMAAAAESSNQFEFVGSTRHYTKAVETVHGFESRRVKGQHFTKKAAEKAEPKVKDTIIKTLTAELEKEWQKK